MAAVGMDRAGVADLSDAHDLVSRLIAPPTAGLQAMREMQAHTGACIYVFRERGRITGVAGELPLTAKGLNALTSGLFDALSPALSHVAAPGDTVAAFYCWGCAGETRRGAAAAVKAVVHARRAVYAEVPFFTRAGKPLGAAPSDPSKGGRAAARRLGCRDYPGTPGLIFAPALDRAGGVAA